MQAKWHIAGLLCAAMTLPVSASSDLGLRAPYKLGEATLRFLGFEVYSATLYTEGTEVFGWERPLALRLDYARGFTRDELLQGTQNELERIEGTPADRATLLSKLAGCYRDVEAGDHYVAVTPTRDRLELRLNGRTTCEVIHSDVRKRFLSIWLSPKSRAARLSARLRGE